MEWVGVEVNVQQEEIFGFKRKVMGAAGVECRVGGGSFIWDGFSFLLGGQNGWGFGKQVGR